MSGLGHIGRYELLSRIGAGGMGEIYLARTTGAGGFEKRVVIKRILPHLAADPEFVRRFIEEGKLVVQLRHAAIAQVLDMGEEGGATFIAMEHVDGRDLSELMRLARTGGVATPTPIAVTILVRVLEALDYAHRAATPEGAPMGIIHRDVSPANVMVARTGEVKLLDFGIAKATERVDTTATGTIRGKYNYMSPQQAEGRPLDARTDLFSVGVLAWELFTGKRPFDGDSDVLTLDRIRFHDPGPLREHGEVPEDVAAVVDKLLAKEPDARWQTAEDAIRAFQGYLVRTGAIPSARDVAGWVDRVLATLPPGMRALQGGALSLDDALRLGLDSAPAPPRTASAQDDTPFARTQTEPPTPRVTPGPTPGAVAFPEAAGVRPTTEPRAVTSDLQAPAPAIRKRTALLIVLIAFNLALLVAVGWLVLRETRNGPQPALATTVEATALRAIAADDIPQAAPVAVDAAAGDGAADTVGGAVVADDDGAVDVPGADAGEETGAALHAAGEIVFRPEVDVQIVTTPRGAAVSHNHGGDKSLKLRPGARVQGRATHDGYEPRGFSFVVGDDGARESVTLVRSAPALTGRVKFRTLPFNATVTLDGRPVTPNAMGYVQAELPVGPHVIVVTASADCRREHRFDLDADEEETEHLDATCP